jgi:hypothetical protein
VEWLFWLTLWLVSQNAIRPIDKRYIPHLNLIWSLRNPLGDCIFRSYPVNTINPEPNVTLAMSQKE